MATSRNVQYIGKDATGTRIDDSDLSSRRQVEGFIAGAAIAVGDWVILDTSATGSLRACTVIKAPASSVSAAVIGCALEAATAAGDIIQVVVKGYHASATVNTATAVGDALFCGGTAAGTAEPFSQATATVAPCGVALAADTAGVAPVYVSGVF
jgi:hypothetical protein